MSYDYHLIVPASRWPTFGDLQVALDADGFPIRLSLIEQGWSKLPFSITKNGFGVDVICEGLCVSIFMTKESLSEDDIDFSGAFEFGNGTANAFVENSIDIRIGDIFLEMGGGTSAFDWYPGLLIFSSMVKHFAASAYDPQVDIFYTKDNLGELTDMAKSMLGYLDQSRHLYRPCNLYPDTASVTDQ